ncbi:low-affinity inorganic phosphate transporter [Citrobacter amalonaticus]|nr:low-affinity inorganic phosphate transporter [Citrobacter amalonaticus]
MLSTIEYAPIWIIMAVALALGMGTMIGWRRVATTIGEKIGKKGMTYAQGMSAQITAAISIGLASYIGDAGFYYACALFRRRRNDDRRRRRITAENRHQHRDGLGIHVTSGDFAVRVSVLGFPATYLNQLPA